MASIGCRPVGLGWHLGMLLLLPPSAAVSHTVLRVCYGLKALELKPLNVCCICRVEANKRVQKKQKVGPTLTAGFPQCVSSRDCCHMLSRCSLGSHWLDCRTSRTCRAQQQELASTNHQQQLASTRHQELHSWKHSQPVAHTFALS